MPVCEQCNFKLQIVLNDFNYGWMQIDVDKKHRAGWLEDCEPFVIRGCIASEAFGDA